MSKRLESLFFREMRFIVRGEHFMSRKTVRWIRMIQIVLYRILWSIPRFLILPGLWKARAKRESVLVAEFLSYPGQTWFHVFVVSKRNHSCPLRDVLTHTQPNTVSTFLLVLIREYNGWLSTRKGLSAFKLALFTDKISSIKSNSNILWKLSLPF